MTLSISLPWNKEDDMSPRDMLQSVKDLGLDAVELGYTLTYEQVEAMVPLMQTMGIKCHSVHNFSPIPNDKPSPRHPSNHYRLTALDEDERLSAVIWTNKTVDTAVRVGASAVVIHAGMIELGDPRSPEVLGLYKEGKADSEEFRRNREALLKERAVKKGPYLDALKKSLEAVLAYAGPQGIRIGFETRYYPTEIPNFQEIGEFLALYRGQGLAYWHDVGHAETNSRLGITPHMDYLNAYGRDMIGIHLHGMKVLRDHMAPFCGDMDLEPVLPFIRPDTICVIESRYASFEQLKNAVQRLKSCLP